MYSIQLSQPALALAHYDTSLVLAVKVGHVRIQVSAFNGTGHSYKLLGRYEKAMQAQLKAIQLSEIPPVDSLLLGQMYSNLGLMYELDRTKARACYAKALALIKNPGNRVYTTMLLATEYAEDRQYDSAITIYRQVIEQIIKNGDSITLANVYNNMGSTFTSSGKIDSARIYIKKSIDIRKKKRITYGLGISLMLLARTYITDPNPRQGIPFFEEALTHQPEGEWRLICDMYDVGGTLYAAAGEYQSAFTYAGKALAAKDSLIATEERRKADIARENYDLDKRDKQIAALEVEKARKTRQRNLAFAGVGGLLLLAGAGYALLRSRQQLRLQRAELAHSAALNEQQETDRRQLASELHDGVAQDLMMLRQSLTKHQLPELARQADQSIESLRSTARFLYPASLSQTGLQSALQHLLTQWEAKTPVFLSYEFEYPAGWVPAAQEIHLYRFVQEAVTNALKHAAPKAIQVEMEQKAGILQVRVRDNGAGFSPQTTLARPDAFGLLSLFHRANVLGGTLQIDSSPGTGTILTLSVPSRPAQS